MKSNLFFVTLALAFVACDKKDGDNFSENKPLEVGGKIHKIHYEDIDDEFSGVKILSYEANKVILVNEEKSKEGNRKVVEELIFNEKGKPVSATVKENNLLSETYQATYNSNGDMIKLVEEEYSNSGILEYVKTTNYTYKEGKVSEQESVTTSKKVGGGNEKPYKKKIYFKFLENQRIEYSVEINANTGEYSPINELSHRSFQYDEKGNLIEELRVSGGELLGKTVYEYDDQINPLFSMNITFDNKGFGDAFKPTGIPVSKNNRIKSTSIGGSAPEMHESKFEYDAKGRPVKNEGYENANLTGRATFSYYE
ncbi:hypothetical protein [Capnocytophaga cynodegmi]|uniref:Uncharacterized protein n=1 Tax=Capnocytophaga cynodegmi TaxID=28189 RepID=A0A0B7HH84_9FLAO|nr:hypothetical protein [Capnocytophaga cynodegmi]CEN38620.1 hypothetical protein CCYN74_30215 [Capnocytophaga cynodegmi]